MKFGRGSEKTLLQMATAIIAACAARAQRSDIELTRARKTERPKEKRSAPIDFHAVPEHQRDIDARLRNWGVWCNSTATPSSAPMFRLAVPSVASRRDRNANSTSIDRSDAIRIAQAVTALPEKHAAALNWCYVKPVGPRRAAESIGVSMTGLAQLLNDARQMLINRLYANAA